jgi:hypothetical protein
MIDKQPREMAMKLKILFVVLFCAGFAASIALGSPSGDGHGKRCTTSTATTTAITTTTAMTTTSKSSHGHDDGDDNNNEHHGKTCTTTSGTTATTATTTTGATTTGQLLSCRRVKLRGTLAAGTVTMSVDSTSSRRIRSLAATQVTVTVPAGPGRISARLCTDAAGKQTLQLSSLRAGQSD